MDIQIVHAELAEEKYLHVHREYRDKKTGSINRMPKEILAIRAAEYNLEIDDPRVLDIVLLEPFFPISQVEIHPLFGSETIEEALAHQEMLCEYVRNQHAAPSDPVMRSLFTAADTGNATDGLVKAKGLLIKHAPRDIEWAVKHHRDRARAQTPKQPIGYTDQLKREALSQLHTEAIRVDSSYREEGNNV